MRAPLSYIPLLPITLAFITGIIIADCGVYPIGIIMIIVLSIILFFRGNSTISIILIALAIGWGNMYIQTPPLLDQSLQNQQLRYSGTVISVTESETSRHLIIDINPTDSTTNIKLRCKLTLPSTHPLINQGDVVLFITQLEKPQNKHDLPEEWDMESFLYHQGITATAYIQPEDITIIGQNENLFWSIRRIQHQIISLLGASTLSDDATEFLIATITGDDELLLAETRKNYSSAGLAHILALSGLHVGIIALVIAIILFPLSVMGYKKARLIITIILLWVYAIMTGLTPSVTRAVIMTTLYLIGFIIQRRHSSINALCFAALLILVVSPLQLYSAGFQLSFAAVTTILLFSHRINPINRKYEVWYYITSMACVSISATLGTALISAYYFHSFPVYFLLCNVLVIFLLPIIISGGILLIIFEACGFYSNWVCEVLDFIYNIIAKITETTTALPLSKIDNIYFSKWLFIPYIITLILLFMTLIYRRLSFGFMTAIGAISTISVYYICKPTFPKIEFYIPRDTYYTNIITRIDSSMYLFTTAHHSKYDEVIERAKFKYKDYMGQRDIEDITFVSDSFYSPLFSCHGRNIIVNNSHFIIVDDKNDIYPCPTRPNYAIVCRGFNGEITNVAKIINADTILLSYDLHPRRHDRYMKECKASDIPCRSLRNR